MALAPETAYHLGNDASVRLGATFMRANPKRLPMSRRQQRAIVQMRREGLQPETIAAAVGCHRATVYRVLARRRATEAVG